MEEGRGGQMGVLKKVIVCCCMHENLFDHSYFPHDHIVLVMIMYFLIFRDSSDLFLKFDWNLQIVIDLP